jgi:hypothetical protein
MVYSRQTRFVSSVVALLSLLVMQLAMAAYACPNLTVAKRALMLDNTGQPMANCPENDKQSPTLCYADAHKQTPSLDKPDAPSVMPFVATGLAQLIVWQN